VADVPRSTLQIKLLQDPSTIYRRYVLDIKGPDIRVRQYERGQWDKQRMKDLLSTLQHSPSNS
jgi:hypothetical protein